MFLRCAVALSGLVSLSIAASPALACRGGADCYDRVRLPDVYRTVDRPVVVRRGYREVYETDPVVVVRPERVMIAPGRVDYAMMPPVTRTEFREVVVRRPGWRWETTWGPYGERRCRVPVPAETKLVASEVVVRPARAVPVVTPPIYGVRQRVYGVRQRALAVRPAARYVVDRPPVIRYQRARVLVRHGGSAWVPARGRW